MSQSNNKEIIIKGARAHNLKNIDVNIKRNKLTVVTDNDLDAFVMAIIKCSEAPTSDIPKQFYETYNWSKIIERMEL